jgi:hypothetical protein
MQNDMQSRSSIVECLKREGYPLTPASEQWANDIERKLPSEVTSTLVQRDGAARLIELLPKIIPQSELIEREEPGVWHLCGQFYFTLHRYNEALGVISAMYDQMLLYQQQTDTRIHKGWPLIRMGECHSNLNHPVLAKRYFMLTACEDAIKDDGQILPDQTGIYFRLIWERGFSHRLLSHYAREVWQVSQRFPVESRFPEWIVQELSQDWMIEFPSMEETGLYFVTIPYVKWLLDRLGSEDRLRRSWYPGGCRSRFSQRVGTLFSL